MKYAYEDLSDEQFEKLVVFLCRRLLGVSVQGFAKGPDGGRDAKFVGTAELHPSKNSPWTGTTIIQAKHTNGYNKSFSESDFHSPKSNSTVLAKELPRIQTLRANNQLDNYMLFSNRRLSGIAESGIRDFISKACNIPAASLYLCGVEQLESWLKEFPDVAVLADLDPLDSPLIISPDKLADVVQAFAENKTAVSAALDNPPTPRIPYETKNALNKMTAEYAQEQRKRYLKETAQIKKFLAAPENEFLLKTYEATVEEFQLKIISKRKNYHSFDEVMEYIAKLLLDRDPILRQNARLTRAMLFYMYWNCDIGEMGDAETN